MMDDVNLIVFLDRPYGFTSAYLPKTITNTGNEAIIMEQLPFLGPADRHHPYGQAQLLDGTVYLLQTKALVGGGHEHDVGNFACRQNPAPAGASF
jgi:hypothetical protein